MEYINTFLMELDQPLTKLDLLNGVIALIILWSVHFLSIGLKIGWRAYKNTKSVE
jgi:hypothetical protein